MIFNKEDNNYEVQIEHDGKLHSFGTYQFSAEAALAADKGAMLGSNQDPNFSNREEYETAVSKDINGQSVDAKSYEAVAEKVRVCLNKLYAEDEEDKAQVASKNTKPRVLTNEESVEDDEEMSVLSDESSVSNESGATGDDSNEESIEEETLSLSDLKGAYLMKDRNKYQSMMSYKGTTHSLGKRVYMFALTMKVILGPC